MAEYDKLINWEQFYNEYLRGKITVSGNQLKGLCPLHDDRDPSFTANLENGLWECKGCNEKGNGIQFLMKVLGISKEEAYKEMQVRHGGPEPPKKKEKRKYTVDDYAAAKKLPVDFLREIGLQNGKTGITIPYMDESGARISSRQRYGDTGSGPKFTWTRGSKVNLYGLWKMDQIREAGYVIAVEGECLPGDAEILTENGWQNIEDFDGGKVAQWRADGVLEMVEPSRFVKYKHDGEMIQFTNQRKFYAKVTPEHKMVTLDRKNGRLSWIKAKDVKANSKLLPRVGTMNGPGIMLSDAEIKLSVAVLADGSVHERKEMNNYVFVNLSKERKINRLLSLLEEMDIEYSNTEAKDKPGHRYIKFHLPDNLKFIERNRLFPQEWLCQATLKQRKLILEEMVFWDGNSVPNREQVEYSSKDYENAKWMQTMAHTAGMVSTIIARKNGFGNWYKVSVLKTKQATSYQALKKENVNFKGYVYCLTVPSGMFLVRQNGCISVTGNSDSHTLWFHEFPALGVPGASTFHAAWGELLKGLEVYIFQEPDIGGETFVRKVCEGLMNSSFEGDAYAVQLIDSKDPSELHCKDPERFKEHFQAALETAEKLNVAQAAGQVENVFPDAPVQLRRPPKWQFGEQGIQAIDEKTGLPAVICRTPILLSKRLKSLETGEEKMEICFRRDGEWHNEIVKRSTLFQARTITQLADLGITVTSENSKFIVQFLQALEAENIDLLERAECVSQLGWHGKQFVPGCNNALEIDVDPSTRRWLDAYHPEGTLESWLEIVKPHRVNPIFRFILASAFAAPLLRLTGHRIFIVHNWGDTRAGKTAALKAALSAWGDPEQLMTSFYATRVGLERLAGFFRDLPLGVDEKQVSGSGDFGDNLMYMLALGQGKVRGAKSGGLQASQAWRTIVLTTGEEPLSSMVSHSGVHSRVLELHGAPFEEEKDAQRFHELHSFGQAGPEFIRRIMNVQKDEVTSLHAEYAELLGRQFKNRISAHVSATAIVAVADRFVSEWLFGQSEDESLSQSFSMAEKILEVLEDSQEVDLIERAYEHVQGWILANHEKFTEQAHPPRLGLISEEGRYYVFPQELEKELTRAGFSYRRVMQGFKDKELIETDRDRKRFAVTKWFEGHAAKFICLRLERPEEVEIGNDEEESPF